MLLVLAACTNSILTCKYSAYGVPYQEGLSAEDEYQILSVLVAV